MGTAAMAGGPREEEEEGVFDALIIGAGLSGINSAYRLQKAFPGIRYVVLEAREKVGGTWSFWQYPGVRSDSPLALFGLAWHPYKDDVNFADAGLIAEYLEDAVAAAGIGGRIRFGHRVVQSSWSTADQMWSMRVEVKAGAEGEAAATTTTTTKIFRTRWIIGCGGYYDYERPLPARIPGLESFGGEVAHPQFWTDDVAYAGRRVVIVGSGATAVTMLPHVAKTAAHVTLLQRSPSHVLALPRRDAAAELLRRLLPRRLAAHVDWWRRMVVTGLFVWFITTFTRAGAWLLRQHALADLPSTVDVDIHFKPSYAPFEQRLCMCPDGDFFAALHQPNCEIVTDTIDTVTPTGIRLASGRQLDADLIITATGLLLRIDPAGAEPPLVDGSELAVADRYLWRGCMIEDLPNACLVFGYTTGTWTPGADMRFAAVLKVMQHMRATGATSVRPRMPPAERAVAPRLPMLHNSSTYIVTAHDRLPLSTGRDPWHSCRSWFSDTWSLWFGGVTNGLEYTVLVRKKQ